MLINDGKHSKKLYETCVSSNRPMACQFKKINLFFPFKYMENVKIMSRPTEFCFVWRKLIFN